MVRWSRPPTRSTGSPPTSGCRCTETAIRRGRIKPSASRPTRPTTWYRGSRHRKLIRRPERVLDGCGDGVEVEGAGAVHLDDRADAEGRRLRPVLGGGADGGVVDEMLAVGGMAVAGLAGHEPLDADGLRGGAEHLHHRTPQGPQAGHAHLRV